MATTVVNRRRDKFDIYIGRGSIWGNPFTHLSGPTRAIYTVATREEAIDSYREWVKKQPELMAQLSSLKGKVLGCYCKPQDCHGDILSELADAT